VEARTHRKCDKKKGGKETDRLGREERGGSQTSEHSSANQRRSIWRPSTTIYQDDISLGNAMYREIGGREEGLLWRGGGKER
jgi:hypothetical protein